jgi:hypothetical protein
MFKVWISYVGGKEKLVATLVAAIMSVYNREGIEY